VIGRTVPYMIGDDGRVEVVGKPSGTRERIGEQIRAERIAGGLSQAELARRIGVSPAPCPRSSGAAMARPVRP
jgi:helix-turn-helix protein